jgi:DNA transformation protein and related proteins
VAVDESFRVFVEEQLGRVMPVRTRRMFGGLGIYARSRFFALVADDVLYFKVGPQNLADFEARGCEPFRPFGDERAMNYREVPADVLEDVELLETWMEKAVAVAEAAAGKK